MFKDTDIRMVSESVQTSYGIYLNVKYHRVEPSNQLHTDIVQFLDETVVKCSFVILDDPDDHNV